MNNQLCTLQRLIIAILVDAIFDIPEVSKACNQLRWWYTPAIMIFMTFFLVKYLAKGAGTEAK